ncbi:hypothetical protein GALMADRAFT_228739 [Galerina marginata CBS 339.88]|uniref:RxLR effector protein n=1 Tax=Galerina marginata (strain CBS 339.88) TaxID=685588 RepID=A0A067SQA3_GALM3|nr:hypothetical protein GALMADRAFT_228739 [Galerina marginata CBS 339.88]
MVNAFTFFSFAIVFASALVSASPVAMPAVDSLPTVPTDPQFLKRGAVEGRELQGAELLSARRVISEEGRHDAEFLAPVTNN